VPANGTGLAGVLSARRDRLAVAAGGLDLDYWNPRRDPHLTARYDADSLDRRARNKRALQKDLGLPLGPRTPLIGVVAGVGLDLAVAALTALLAGPDPAHAIVLGPPPSDLAGVKALAGAFPAQVRWQAGLDPVLASRLMAGADLLLVTGPASAAAVRIALRYGAVPVAGGQPLIDYAEARRGTGFVFADYNVKSIVAALQQALRVYARPTRWQALQRRGMRQALQFAWTHAAADDLALYQQAITFRKEAVTTLTHRLAGDRAADGPEDAGSGLAGAGLATLP
jgi:starch synthase